MYNMHIITINAHGKNLTKRMQDNWTITKHEWRVVRQFYIIV